MADQGTPKKEETSDRSILDHIQRLVAQEQELYEQKMPSDEQRDRLRRIGVELDLYWDLLRQRRALREYGRDPGEAHLRPPAVVEKYEG